MPDRLLDDFLLLCNQSNVRLPEILKIVCLKAIRPKHVHSSHSSVPTDASDVRSLLRPGLKLPY
jgi:hypothetical protein